MVKPVFDEERAERVERFFGRHLRHMKGRWAGQPFILEPWQRDDIIYPLFGTIDPKTKRRHYREALIGVPRKNGKSELAAGMALYSLIADGEFAPEVYSVAGDRKQASLVFNTAADMVLASPTLRAACKVYRGGKVIEVRDINGIYRALSADADLQHGLNPSCAIIDEYHVHRNAEQYEAMRTGTAAREQPLIVTITTAGAEKRGPAWDLYEKGRDGKDPKMLFRWWGAPADVDLKDRKAWRAANPASWVSLDFLADQMPPSLPESVFRRLHLNQWYEGALGAWIPRDSWLKCIGTPEIDPSLPAVIGVDAASRQDTTAVALVQVGADGRFHTKVWSLEADEGLGYLDYSRLEDLLREICSTYQVTRLAFDPFQMIRTQQILGSEGLPTEVFPQSDQRMVPASQLLYDLVMEEKLVHDGDPLITEQVLAAGIRESARGWRLDKRKSSRPIDSVIALAIGCQLAQYETELSAGPRVLIV